MSFSPELRAQLAREAAEKDAAARCRSCGADILWAEWKEGQKHPIDAVPDNRPLPKGGKFILMIHDGKLRAAIPVTAVPRTRNRYTSHFASCPNASEHRRPR